MSINHSLSRIVHPNRLVLKHEEFLVNKSLANKVRYVKPTVNSCNYTFEKVILTRQQKGSQRSFINKSKFLEDCTEIETSQVDNNKSKDYMDLLSPKNRDISPRPSDIMPLKLISPSARENKANYTVSVRSALAQRGGSPRLKLTRVTSLKNLPEETPMPQGNKEVANLKRGNSIENQIRKNNKIELLQNKLVEKSIEIESLKNELKDWWHEDLKETKKISFKENIEEDVQNKKEEHNLDKYRLQTPRNNKAFSVEKSESNGLSARQQSSMRMRSNLPIKRPDLRQMASLMIDPATYEESIRILEKFEEYEQEKKKQSPSHRDRSEKRACVENSLSPKPKIISNSDKVTSKVSSNTDQGILRRNFRYKSQGVSAIEEIKNRFIEEFNPSIRQIQQGINNKHSILQTHREELQEEEIAVTVSKKSKTSMRPRIFHTKNNMNSFRLPQVIRENEVII